MHLEGVKFFPEKYPTSDHYPFNQEIFSRTGSLKFHRDVTFFVGENGTGKSTLLYALAQKCGIHIWSGTETTRFERNPYEGSLHRCMTVDWTDGAVPGSFFSSELFNSFSKYLDEWAAADPHMLKYFGGKSLITQSHGQSLMSYFRNRYRIRGLYLLDEPETALSPKSLLALLGLLGPGDRLDQAQFIIATHSPILLACQDATIYSFDHCPVKSVAYEETEHYRIYKSFMEDSSRFL